jgi:hypothetical protein
MYDAESESSERDRAEKNVHVLASRKEGFSVFGTGNHDLPRHENEKNHLEEDKGQEMEDIKEP